MPKKAHSKKEDTGWPDVVVVAKPGCRDGYTGISALPSCYLSFSFKKPPPEGYPRTLKRIGDHIRKKRMDLGLYQKDVGKIIGVSTSTVTTWELNHNKPIISHWPAIMKFLGYNPFPPPTAMPERLRAVRLRLGLSQKNLAKKIGLDTDTICRIEDGTREPSCHSWPTLIKLFGGDPRPKPETIADRIYVARTRLGLTQRAFAKAVGLHHCTAVYCWENGINKPQKGLYPNLEKLLKKAGV